MSENRSSTGSNGVGDTWKRDVRGRFGPGNRGGKGGAVLASKMAALRHQMVATVTPGDIEAIVQALVAKAREGDVPCAREVLDRCCGRAEAVDLAARIEEMEEVLGELEKGSPLEGPAR